jgi:hypothetical protein
MKVTEVSDIVRYLGDQPKIVKSLRRCIPCPTCAEQISPN